MTAEKVKGYANEGICAQNYHKWATRRGRNFNTFKEGDKITFCRCPKAQKGSLPKSAVDVVPQPLIEYEGVVVQITEHHITVDIRPREGQICGFSNKVQSYKVSLSRLDVGVTDLIKKEECND